VVILRLRNMTALDATGLFALEEVAKTLQSSKRTLIVCGAREQPAKLIHQAEFVEVAGLENICDNVQEALCRAEEVYKGLEAKFVVGKSRPFIVRISLTRVTLRDRDVPAARLFCQGIPGECKSASPRPPTYILKLATSTLAF
jgi:hypothetical protein